MAPERPKSAVEFIDLEWKRMRSRLGDIKTSHEILAGHGGRLTTVNIALKSLHAFAEQQFRFFYYGFISRNTLTDGEHHGFLDFDPVYPAEYALQVTAEQVANDKDVLLRVLSHRHQDISTPTMQTRLQLADVLAYRALKAAFYKDGEGLIIPSTVLTYFQKSASIRMIPYAPLALIGLPLTADAEEPLTEGTYLDLLSIPHEVGHHVYWRNIADDSTEQHTGERVQSILEKQIPGLPNWIRNWEEEIFADVYGLLVAGPISALSIQELVKAAPAHKAIVDDGHYPSPVLRPLIQIVAIEVLADRLTDGTKKQRLQNVAQALRIRWQLYVKKQRVLPLWFIPFGEKEPVTLFHAERLLANVVTTLLNSVFAYLLPDKRTDFWDSWWSHGLDETVEVKDESSGDVSYDLSRIRVLFDQFQDTIDRARQEINTIPELVEVSVDSIQLKLGDEFIGEPIPIGTSGQNLPFEKLRDDALKSGISGETQLGAPAWWLPVLRAAFWTTGGPTGGNLGDG